jgi:simple sugar transport system permease protein
MVKSNEKNVREPLFHVVKRDDLPTSKAWLIRIATIVISFLIVGIFCVIVTGKGFGKSFEIMFMGVFGRLFQGNTTMLWKYFQEIADSWKF